MGNITPRELFYSAIFAGLPMRGIVPASSTDMTPWVRSPTEGFMREASLADIEAVVELELEAHWVVLAWRHRVHPTDEPLRFDYMVYDREADRFIRHNIGALSKAECLKAACDALAKGKV